MNLFSIKHKKLLASKFLLLALFFIIGCSPESDEIITPSLEDEQALLSNISLKSNRVVFSSIDAYQKFLEDQDVEQRVNLVNQLNNISSFISLSSLIKADLSLSNGRIAEETLDLEGTIIADLLNEDGIIEIGEYLFKINMSQEQVLALHRDNLEDSYNALLEGDTNNDDILLFSTNDDVLEMISNGETSSGSNARTALFGCGENGADKDIDEDNEYYGSDRRMVCRVEYQKYGIYFSLIAKVKSQKKVAGIWVGAGYEGENQGLDFYVKYKPKCRSEVVKQGTVYEDSGDNNELSKRPYESTRKLHKYHYEAQFSNFYWNQGTRVYTAEDGY
ncbi:hypothetical protein [Chondrinema litorale]|uniref:hypothetical protein n=1 Tax=Chondrinema litorale TaxID=2994555 RepID=UPI0025437A7E|nr:hypothetical protein [Chondrinema litorale]UZS00049.1 hypothetical protein OQ292_39610 [Chondrinema litorale]